MNDTTITVLLVDDEPEALDLLTMLLDRIGNTQIIGRAESADDALAQVIATEPDLLLLDIQMPGKNGFDLVHSIREQGKDTGYIFVTAFDEYAIQAVRSSAFDYLLKPVDPEELQSAIGRFRQEREQKLINLRIDELLAGLGIGARLKLNTRTGFMIIDPKEIVCCIADGNYTEILLANDRREVISSNLGTLEKELFDNVFFRISRSSLINLRYVTHVENRTGTCRLQGASVVELKVARNRLRKLEARL